MTQFTPDYRFCPRCATPLVERYIHDATRLTCPGCDFILYESPKLVAVVVVMHNGQALLGKRNINPGIGEWSFVSGYIDRGEKVEEAAIREVKEETNLDVQLEQLLGIFSGAGNPHAILAYQASAINGDVSGMTAQPDEVSELAFFNLEDMPPLAFPADTEILRVLRQRHGRSV